MKITAALIAEHTIFLKVFDEIERVLPSLTTAAEVRTMARIIEGMLESHAKTETEVAYLALDHVLQQKGELKKMYQDHHEIDERLRKVHTTNTCAEARRLLKLVIQTTRDHFRSEERLVFPMLEKALKEETLLELGAAWIQRNASPTGRA